MSDPLLDLPPCASTCDVCGLPIKGSWAKGVGCERCASPRKLLEALGLSGQLLEDFLPQFVARLQADLT